VRILCTRGSKSVVPKDHVGVQQKSRYYETFKRQYKIVWKWQDICVIK